jgi:hypothetical protein
MSRHISSDRLSLLLKKTVAVLLAPESDSTHVDQLMLIVVYCATPN